MAELFRTQRLIDLLDRSVERWHGTPITHDERELFFRAALLIHSYNFELWHQEDRARSPAASDRAIARVKRAIDRLNQQRNDAIQALDELVRQRLEAANPKTTRNAPLNSETVGAIADRLSILALKIYHMREETLREEAGAQHREQCAAKLAILEQQQADLGQALQHLQADLLAGRRRFKVYFQMKMYNDPALNPVVYTARKRNKG